MGAPGPLKKLRRRRAAGRKGAGWTAPQRGHESIKRLVHAIAMHSHVWQHSVKKRRYRQKKTAFFLRVKIPVPLLSNGGAINLKTLSVIHPCP